MSKIRIVCNYIFAVLMSLALSACGSTDYSQVIPAITQTQFDRPPEDMRDFRYCEVLPIFQSGTNLYIEVYTTIGLNNCPDEEWRALNAEDIADEYGTTQVTMNGPRFWLVNKSSASGASAEGKIADFGGIEMRQAAILELQLSEVKGNVGEEFYVENEVQRTTTYLFSAGNMIYELTSPEGDVYRMQSYAQIIDPTLTIDDLETLGDRLDLPDGWRYEARVLSEESQLIVDGLAFVINDELMNSYQKVTVSANGSS